MTIWDIFVRRKNISRRKKEEKIKSRSIEEYNFKYEFTKWNVSSDENSTLNMNEIIQDSFSIESLKKKSSLVQKTVQKVKKTIIFAEKKKSKLNLTNEE